MRILFLFTLFLLSLTSYSQNQVKKLQTQNESVLDTSKFSNSKSKKGDIYNEKASIEQYLIISSKRDTTYVDTTLSIRKDYKFNYLRKDNFELISFSNIGQTYNSLSKNLVSKSTLPLFGARARHFNYMEIEDINYYYVPTPFTELFFKTAFEQGQVLDAFFSVNTSPQFNFSIAYKGLRSLGNYQHILTSTGNLRFTTNFHTKNHRYNIRAHIVTQDLLNQENGGIKDEDIQNFESGNEDFIDRAVFDPQFENAESILRGKRFYLEHEYKFSNSTDSIANVLRAGQIISFEDKYYQFDQTQENEYFGEAFISSIVDRTTLEDFYNRFYLNFEHQVLGNFQFNLDYHNYNYGYNSVTILDNETLPNRIKESTFALGGIYSNNFGKLFVSSELKFNLNGDIKGDMFNANAQYKFTNDFQLKASLFTSSSAPSFNHLLYKSGYINYNWSNSDTYKNVNTRQFLFELNSAKIVNLTFDYTNIDNYTFFTKIDEGVNSIQSSDQINYLRVKINKEIKYGKFALENTIMYQNVIEGDNMVNVPDFISRNTLYYSNHFFKKALFLQTGVTLNYFSEYYMDAYDPLLAEFYVQNDTEIGNFPRLDFFLNAKIRQTRIFFKAEHFNAAFTGYDYFSAPNYPYRDFAIRFGLVWDFFL
ncbi:putative porin [Psychroserpens ponticola]|uniref:Porin n=1 Tax=Psychroserpens ponticola TaxID=2932268 RepID=A0ABY7RVA3_9FLAO|nr:putative porin [Psychroserpens ponticola]WCO01029.1 putative porin [Psychroserpens ponticola]